MDDDIKGWQIQLGFWGGLFLMASFPMTELFKKNWPTVSLMLSGYKLGAVTSLSGFAIKEILNGKLHRFIDQSKYFKPVSVICLVMILLVGLFGLISVNLYQFGAWYNLSFVFGTVVAGWGVIPIVNIIDK